MSTQVSTSTTRSPVTHTVAVEKAGYTFQPDIVGDFIEYAFYPVNHSVVQAAYGCPCVPYGLVNSRPGFAPPFKPVDAILDEPPTYTVRVNDTEPIFVYCSGPWACIDHGMVAVVNPNANTSLEHQRLLALQADYVLQPGDKWPGEGSSTSNSSSTYRYTTPTLQATVTSTPTPTITSTSETSSTPTSVASASHGLSTGAIAGIAIGAEAVLLMAGITVWLCGRRSDGENNNNNIDGVWYLGRRKGNSYPTGSTTPAAMPASYNPHGVPVMTRAKIYPNGMPTAPIVEHYNLSPRGSSPPQISPHYNQQTFPPHVMELAAYNYSAAYPVVPGQQPRGLSHPLQQHQHFIPPPQHAELQNQHQHQHQPLQPEIYTSTPAHRAAQPISSVYHGMSTTIPNADRTSMSLSAHSRGGSPDVLAEMNAARSQAGTLNHAGGGSLQQPVPIRAGGGLGTGVNRFEV